MNNKHEEIFSPTSPGQASRWHEQSLRKENSNKTILIAWSIFIEIFAIQYVALIIKNHSPKILITLPQQKPKYASYTNVGHILSVDNLRPLVQ